MANTSANDIARQYGLTYRCGHYTGNCPVCGYQGFSVSDKQGTPLFKAHACGCSQDELIQKFREDGLWGSSQPAKATLPTFKQARQQEPAKDSQALALRIWNESRPAKGTIVEQYLHCRGITCPIPEVIRFHPKCWHSGSQTNHPAMVAKVTKWDSDELIAIHRTYLKPDGSWKADVEPNKAMLGSTKGGAVHLTPAGSTLAIAEGLETALAVYQITGHPTWSGLSAGGIESLEMPPSPLAEIVLIYEDNDPVGQQKALNKANLCYREGRRVQIMTPYVWGADFNDVLKSKEK